MRGETEYLVELEDKIASAIQIIESVPELRALRHTGKTDSDIVKILDKGLNDAVEKLNE